MCERHRFRTSPRTEKGRIRNRHRFLATLSRHKRRGFTLIEILIVAALIALLSGIAAINIQSAYVNNQRKSTYGEARSVATAMSFAFEDVGIYPKLCFLRQNSFFIAPPAGNNPGAPGPYLVSGFEYMGHPLSQQPTLIKRVITNWAQGFGSPGYMSASEGKRGLFQGRRGGLVRMEIPMDVQGYDPITIPGGQSLPIYEWPADPWGRPYVIYMLWQEGVRADGLPNVHFVDRPTRSPNYALAVISYGPNGIPGGNENVTAADIATGQSLWLFSRVDRAYPDQSDYRCLRPSEYDPNRMNVYSYQRLLGVQNPNPPGITDSGSDDIVVDFY